LEKNLEKKERGRILGLPKFFEYPLLSQEWVNLLLPNVIKIDPYNFEPFQSLSIFFLRHGVYHST